MKIRLFAASGLAWAALGAHAQLPGPVTLNDTGLTKCAGPDGQFTTACANSGQDAATGRDVSAPDDADGHAGFVFTKIGAKGQRLPAGATAWHCVADDVTGLTWDVSLHGADHRGWSFTNYGDGSKGDASTVVAEANARALCGATNWRLPTLEEMQGIVDESVPQGGGPMLDVRFFRNARAVWYWTSTNYGPDSAAAWAIDFGYLGGGDGGGRRDTKMAVRLVHDAGAAPADPASRYTFSGDEVTDHWTNLVWRRCSEGEVFDGAHCTGTLLEGEWADALAETQAEATRTGLGWRLPNPKELSTIMDRSRTQAPEMDPVVFPLQPIDSPDKGYYWTSSVTAADPGTVWAIDVRKGYIVSYPTTLNPIPWRLVREATAKR